MTNKAGDKPEQRMIVVESCGECGIKGKPKEGCYIDSKTAVIYWAARNEGIHPKCELESAKPSLDTDAALQEMADGDPCSNHCAGYRFEKDGSCDKKCSIRKRRAAILKRLHPQPSIDVAGEIDSALGYLEGNDRKNQYEHSLECPCDFCGRFRAIVTNLTNLQPAERAKPNSCGDCEYRGEDCPFFIDNEFRVKSRAVFVDHHPGEIFKGCPFGESKQPDNAFINHIAAHLEEGQEVVCKICGKTAKEIIDG